MEVDHSEKVKVCHKRITLKS